MGLYFQSHTTSSGKPESKLAVGTSDMDTIRGEVSWEPRSAKLLEVDIEEWTFSPGRP